MQFQFGTSSVFIFSSYRPIGLFDDFILVLCSRLCQYPIRAQVIPSHRIEHRNNPNSVGNYIFEIPQTT